MAGIYVYLSLAFMKIAEKNKRDDGWLAWIPFVGKPLLASKIAKMHWWPVLLLLGVLLVKILDGAIFWIALIVFLVFYYIWRWKVFESVGKPGWFIILKLIPFAGDIIYLVLIGIAAWEILGI